MGNEWTTGFCSNFAVALQRRFGGEIWAMVNHSRKYPEPKDEFLCHCYCVIDGVAYDGEGASTLADASDVSQVSIEEMDKDYDVVIEWRKVNEAWLALVHEDYNPDFHVPRANKFIDRHANLFAKIMPHGL